VRHVLLMNAEYGCGESFRLPMPPKYRLSRLKEKDRTVPTMAYPRHVWAFVCGSHACSEQREGICGVYTLKIMCVRACVRSSLC
jgi:rRNA maturation protein Nop10